MIRTLILAAGPGSRWANYTGVPKHLVELEGRPLLHRTVELFAELGEVEIVAPADHRYQHPRALTSPARLNPANGDADRFASSRHRWDPAAVMVLAFGDVWFDGPTVEAIATATDGDDWAWVARFDGSELTGKPNGEGWAFVLPPSTHELFADRLDQLIQLPYPRKLGWDLYRILEGRPTTEHQRGPHLVEVDDWSEDFDFPHDLDRWAEARRAAGLPLT